MDFGGERRCMTQHVAFVACRYTDRVPQLGFIRSSLSRSCSVSHWVARAETDISRPTPRVDMSRTTIIDDADSRISRNFEADGRDHVVCRRNRIFVASALGRVCRNGGMRWSCLAQRCTYLRIDFLLGGALLHDTTCSL